MRRIAMLSIALLVLTTLLVPQRSESADKPEKGAKPMPADGHFRGKYVAITSKVAGQIANTMLKQVTVKQLGGRTFLVGEYAAEVSEAFEPWKGVRNWVPVDEVVLIYELDDVEQARKFIPPGRPKEVPAKSN